MKARQQVLKNETAATKRRVQLGKGVSSQMRPVGFPTDEYKGVATVDSTSSNEDSRYSLEKIRKPRIKQDPGASSFLKI